jgi:CheY-like chemotaxis protein
MKGPDAAAKLRKMGLKQVIIIGVTGNVLQEDVEHFMQSGADAVLSKPLSMDKLRATLLKLKCNCLGKERLA